MERLSGALELVGIEAVFQQAGQDCGGEAKGRRGGSASGGPFSSGARIDPCVWRGEGALLDFETTQRLFERKGGRPMSVNIDYCT